MTDDQAREFAETVLANIIAGSRQAGVPDSVLAVAMLGSACFVAKGAIAADEWAQVLDMAQAKSLGLPVSPERKTHARQ